ncbi:MAG: DNA repair protein RecO [Candidatus Kerfeldbacteria bacterium]|nr:DNA repair protein RecO [Candidatus Kerfeldbacteria bacterium]
MNSFNTRGIILTRTDYAEADRILTFLTPSHGKLKAIAKGVRKSKSKLAGGIELFCVSDLTVITGRGDIGTLISTRLFKNYSNIVKDLDRTGAGYELIRMINKSTEDGSEETYFNLLNSAFMALNDTQLDPQVTSLWFSMQLLKLAGHTPNLHTDSHGAKLKSSGTYDFHMDRMQFTPEPSQQGAFSANHIKFMRIGFAASKPQILHKIQGVGSMVNTTRPLVQTMLKSFVRV